MAGSYVVPFFFLMVVFVLHASAGKPDRKINIVYMGEVPSHETGNGKEIAAAAHHDMLESVLGSHDAAEKALIYSYGRSFNGFAASLSASEIEVIKNMDGVVSVFENRKMVLHTTRSWDFIGLPLPAKRNLQYESDVIIGMIDTGIWPESESFKDTGLGPVPSKWKGTCETASSNFTCNKKIIGGRFYNKSAVIGDPSKEFFSPRDSNGHGTHTASTAAGNVVRNASLYGVAQGSARGGVAGSRLAVYKVCWGGGSCWDADILAAFDDAINEGVDIISVSLGSSYLTDYFSNSIAIGSFHAMKKGILTSNSAGNEGEIGSITNGAPWSFTVAASTIDRTFQAKLVLGNNKTISGNAINTYSMEKPWYPLIYGGNAPNVSAGYDSEVSSYCSEYSLDSNKVGGKIVICEEGGGYGSFLAGGEGVIEIFGYLSDTSDSSIIPSVSIQSNQADELGAYMNSTRSPVATILKSYTQNKPAPVAASFSSRGPSPFTGSILKPDITAPGVDILAAWSKASSVTQDSEDKRLADYNIISGTSMSCPHVSGAAAYVKSFHPDWSPAAIKSALMTTASPLDPNLPGNGDKELAYGSGQINPVKAIDPGLVYDTNVSSYIDMLCSAGYDTAHLRMVTGDNSTCSGAPTRGVTALNYPSIMVVPTAVNNISERFPRTLTNVGPARSTYRAQVEAHSGMRVTVQPSILAFTSANQSLEFIVNVEGNIGIIGVGNIVISGALTWRYGNYSVRSPILLYYSTLSK